MLASDWNNLICDSLEFRRQVTDEHQGFLRFVFASLHGSVMEQSGHYIMPSSCYRHPSKGRSAHVLSGDQLSDRTISSEVRGVPRGLQNLSTRSRTCRPSCGELVGLQWL